MPSKVGQRRYQRIYNPMGEPGPGTPVAGYARYSSDMQDGITILTQKRKMQALADLKGWLLIRWFEEPAQSAKYEEIAKRPIFAAMLDEAGDAFKAILCYDTSRWARNVEAGMSAINLLRRKQVWWSTYDERHTIDSIQEAGGGLVFGVELHMAQGYVTDLSRRTIDGKEERALAGLHASNAPFGYLPPDYDQRPPLAPANWKPTSKPVRLDPAVRDAFTVIADLTIAGGSAQEIADELTNRGYHPTGRKYSGPVDPRTGTQTSPLQRLFTKDSLQAILMNPFYREFAPDCGKGTITTAQGQAVMGRHDAAWDWETWHRMEAARSLLRRAPNAKRSQRQEYPFAGIIVCSACQYLMRSWHYKRKGQVRQYYTCHSDIKRLQCAARVTTTPAHCVEEAFGYLLAHHRLGDSWQEDLLALMDETPVYDHWQDIADQRKVLEQERELYNTMLLHQGITSEVYGQQMQRINAALTQLPTETTPIERQQEALDAGDVLRGLPECWELARANKDMLQLSELVHGLLQPGGLIWDSASRSIRALRPHPEFMPSLALALLPTWMQEGDTLICQELAASLVPEKHVRPQRQRSVPTMRTLSLAAHADEIERMLRLGHSLQQIANKLGVNRMKVWRYVQKRGQKED